MLYKTFIIGAMILLALCIGWDIQTASYIWLVVVDSLIFIMFIHPLYTNFFE